LLRGEARLAPLLLIAGRERGHVVAQYAHRRLAPAAAAPLARDELSARVGGALATRYTLGARAHVSERAGAGKSFAVRTHAAEVVASLSYDGVAPTETLP
jgi:hypothetical protein